MYLEHFGLREAPFRITPHTEFFFSGANRGATLDALIYAVTHDEGIVKVSGEVGSGKTMLCRMLLERLGNSVDTVYLANPSLSREEILYAIADELQVTIPEGRLHLLLRSLQERLVEIFASGRTVIVMVDEAHAMPPETLEEIRLLSNLESNRHKLLHIVLFGQPELDERLAESHMRQLKERITHNFALEPLHHHDIGSYLMFRLRAAGYRGPDLFTPQAIRRISKVSEGLTRRINILADKALLAAFAEDKHQIGIPQVDAAIRDAQFRPMHHDHPSRARKWVLIAVGSALLAGLFYFLGSRFPRQPVPPQLAVPPAPVAEVMPEPPVPPAETELPVVVAPQEAPAKAPDSSKPPSSLEERLAATDAWLKATPDSHYFIQLLRVDVQQQAAVESFLQRGVAGLDPAQLRVYRSSLSGSDRFGIIYGDFASLEAAQAELARLTQDNRVRDAYVRAITKLR